MTFAFLGLTSSLFQQSASHSSLSMVQDTTSLPSVYAHSLEHAASAVTVAKFLLEFCKIYASLSSKTFKNVLIGVLSVTDNLGGMKTPQDTNWN